MRLRFVFLIFGMLALTACMTPGGYYSGGQAGYAPPPDGYARCQNCGVVERIDRVYGERTSGGGGAVLGGIIGGILGNQVGKGSGRAAATAAGAIAGGVAGNEVERNTQAAPWYELYLRMDDGRRIVITQRDLNGVREGAYIRIRNGRAYLN